MSQLWSCLVLRGMEASGAVKGECFESALEFGGGVAVCFCFGRAGAGGAVSFGVWWCRRRFFFRGDGGQSASSVWLAQRLTRVRKCALSERALPGSGLC